MQPRRQSVIVCCGRLVLYIAWPHVVAAGVEDQPPVLSTVCPHAAGDEDQVLHPALVSRDAYLNVVINMALTRDTYLV